MSLGIAVPFPSRGCCLERFQFFGEAEIAFALAVHS